tara:strand:+ start:4329 stop:4742 length:414 start_codon:yes stop_codon:yes gene_type:complete
MGQNISINRINYENIQRFIKNQDNNNNLILINTLETTNQDCLIYKTVNINDEINIINGYLKKNNKTINIIIYGMNSSDDSVVNKYNQLHKLGFKNLYIYLGGLFEWLLLQDIYGEEEFPTTNKILDILQYKGKMINI